MLPNVKSSNQGVPIWTSLLYFRTIIPASVPLSSISLAICDGVFELRVILFLRSASRTSLSDKERTFDLIVSRRFLIPEGVKIVRVPFAEVRSGGGLAGSLTPTIAASPPLRTPFGYVRIDRRRVRLGAGTSCSLSTFVILNCGILIRKWTNSI